MNLVQLQQRLIQFTEMESFVTLELFRDEFQQLDLEGFEQFVFFKDDSYLSKTLYRAKKFEIRLLCWMPLQSTPKHPHPQNGCLMKILKGKLMEEKFIDNRPIETIYKKDDVGYIKASESHILKNLNANSISLHIYSPSGFYDTIHK